MTSQRRAEIECAILSAFIFSKESGYHDNEIYTLQESIFSTLLRKRVAHVLNASEMDDYAYKGVEMEQSVEGTKYQDGWIQIIGQSPMSIKESKKYHDMLLENDRLEELI